METSELSGNTRTIRDQSPLSRDAVAIGTDLRHGDCGLTINLEPCPGQNSQSIQLNAVEDLTECAVMCEEGFRGVGVGVYVVFEREAREFQSFHFFIFSITSLK